MAIIQVFMSSTYRMIRKQYNQQTNIYKRLAIISPYLPTRFLSMAISNTDYATHWNFSDAAENYRIKTQKFLNDHTAQNTKYRQRGYMAKADFWKKLPAFNYTPPELNNILIRNKSNLFILGIWIIFSFGLFLSYSKKI